jgi:hypothetical protein
VALLSSSCRVTHIRSVVDGLPNAFEQSGILAGLTSVLGTKRKSWNARVFPELGVDRLCHPPAGHSRPWTQGRLDGLSYASMGAETRIIPMVRRIAPSQLATSIEFSATDRVGAIEWH